MNKQSISNTSQGANSLKGDLSLAKRRLKNDGRAGVDTRETGPPRPVSTLDIDVQATYAIYWENTTTKVLRVLHPKQNSHSMKSKTEIIAFKV